jgi:hypothetical protein
MGHILVVNIIIVCGLHMFFVYFYDLIQVVYYQSQCKSTKTGYLNPFNFCLCHRVFTMELMGVQAPFDFYVYGPCLPRQGFCV